MNETSHPMSGTPTAAVEFAAQVTPVSRPTAPAARTYPAPVSDRDDTIEVIDLPAAEMSSESIINAILSQNKGDLIESPLRAPMSPGVRIGITRDRKLVVMAVAREGLSELRSIGQAYRWVCDNRALIGMAMPQFAIDASQQPRLRLFVDHADISADVLHSIMHADHVTVQAYRRLRWGGRNGLFLEAA